MNLKDYFHLGLQQAIGREWAKCSRPAVLNAPDSYILDLVLRHSSKIVLWNHNSRVSPAAVIPWSIASVFDIEHCFDKDLFDNCC